MRRPNQHGKLDFNGKCHLPHVIAQKVAFWSQEIEEAEDIMDLKGFYKCIQLIVYSKQLYNKSCC